MTQLYPVGHDRLSWLPYYFAVVVVKSEQRDDAGKYFRAEVRWLRRTFRVCSAANEYGIEVCERWKRRFER